MSIGSRVLRYLSYLRKVVLLLWQEINVSEEQCIVLGGTLISKVICGISGAARTLYNNCSISLNSSSVNLPGWMPLTSRPKSLNLDGSAVGGRGRGTVSMAMVVSREGTSSGSEGDTGFAYPILCTPPRSTSGFSHDLPAHTSGGIFHSTLPIKWHCL